MNVRIAHKWLTARATDSLERAALHLEDGGVEGVDGALEALAEFKALLGMRADTSGPKMWQEWYESISAQAVNRLRTLGTLAVSLEKKLVKFRDTGVFEDQYNWAPSARLRTLVEGARWIESISETKTREVKHGPFHVIPMPGVSKKQVTEALEALDKAAAFIRPLFPKLLYGKVYVSKTLPDSHSGTVAVYIIDTDTIHLSTKTKKTIGDVHAICHEFGHRYDRVFWKDQTQRDTFRNLSLGSREEVTESFDRRRRERAAEGVLEMVRAQRNGIIAKNAPDTDIWLDHLFKDDLTTFQWLARAALKGGLREEDALREFVSAPSTGIIKVVIRTEKVPPVAVTPYGGTKWTENFAEAFAFHVTGRPIPPELRPVMDALS